jgi:hypothetical protein
MQGYERRLGTQPQRTPTEAHVLPAATSWPSPPVQLEYVRSTTDLPVRETDPMPAHVGTWISNGGHAQRLLTEELAKGSRTGSLSCSPCSLPMLFLTSAQRSTKLVGSEQVPREAPSSLPSVTLSRVLFGTANSSNRMNTGPSSALSGSPSPGPSLERAGSLSCYPCFFPKLLLTVEMEQVASEARSSSPSDSASPSAVAEFRPRLRRELDRLAALLARYRANIGK